MRISRLLAITSSQEEGGAESHLAITLAAARARGWEVDVAFPSSPATAELRERLRGSGCRVHSLAVGAQGASQAGAYLALLRDTLRTLWCIARVRPDAILLNLPAPEASPGAMLACAISRKPSTSIFHLVRADLIVTPRRRRLYRGLARSSQHWICVSEDNRATLAAQFGVERRRFAVVRNGAALREVPGEARERTRAQLQIPADATVVLTTGRLGEQKGHRVIIEALAELVALDRRVLFVWAGDGPSRDQLTRSLQATGLAGHVLLTGRREDIPELLAAADLFLMPSRDEGGAPPFALAEAMLAGVPAVVSDTGALREVIDDGRNGLLFARGDPSDLVRVIGWALAHREELAEIAVRARAQAASEFTVERMTEGLLSYVTPPLPNRRAA